MQTLNSRTYKRTIKEHKKQGYLNVVETLDFVSKINANFKKNKFSKSTEDKFVSVF